jgi:hypothetical protein
VLPLADVVNLFGYELAGLRARGLPLSLVAAGSLDGFFVGHHDLPLESQQDPGLLEFAAERT